MPIANMLIDSTFEHIMVNFMDGNVDYDQVYTAKDDVTKTMFLRLSALRTCE